MFYDEDWRQLSRKHPLVAKKIEELRCETVNYEQYETEIKRLKAQVKVLLETNGVKQPNPAT